MWKFTPILKTTLWGGRRIPSYKQASGECHGLEANGVGESWELSGLPGNLSVVAEGDDIGFTLRELIAKYGEAMMGKKNFQKYGEDFPVLIKIIDAAMDLSVQVHPNDEVARRHGADSGKTEMWYVLEAEKDSSLVNGFNREITPEEYDTLVGGDKIMDVLNKVKANPGDCFFIPAGRVHSIGRGILLAEVQQSSDVTYRLYDHGRLDHDGRPRKLHTELAREAIDFNSDCPEKTDYTPMKNFPVNLVSTPCFTVNLLDLDLSLLRDYSEWDTFVAIVCTNGEAEICGASGCMKVSQGETLLIPASSKGVNITPGKHFKALEVYVK